MPPVGEGLVVEDHEGAVGGAADVEFDPVGAERSGGLEGDHGVLRERGGSAPVGDDEGHEGRCSWDG